MKAEEYIIPINETAKDYDEMFVGVIRRQPVLIRCKDCAYWTDADTEHLAGYCHYREAEEITFSFEYCAWAERKEE